MRYKCLVLDHDDTAVRSTPELHYPSFLEIMDELRPGEPKCSIEDFVRACFNPGFDVYCREVLKFSEEEMVREYQIWKDYIKCRTPEFYPGFLDMVREFERRGGIICAVSHSEKAEIVRHYAEHGIELTQIYGWELPPEMRKPHPYPMEQILETLELKPAEVIMLDDLRLGCDMAKSCGVDFATAGWGIFIDEIRDFMRSASDYYFDTVKQFTEFLFAEE